MKDAILSVLRLGVTSSAPKILRLYQKKQEFLLELPLSASQMLKQIIIW